MLRDNAVIDECKMRCNDCVYDGSCEIPAQHMQEMLDERTISMNYMIDTDTRES